MRTKLILAGIVLAAILGVIARERYQSAKIDRLTQSNNALTGQVEAKSQRVTELENEARQADANRQSYLDKLETEKREREKLQDCIADKSCGFTVRVRTKTVCPGSGETSAEGDTGGIETEATLAPDAERAYLRHDEEISIAESQWQLCLDTLHSWGGR